MWLARLSTLQLPWPWSATHGSKLRLGSTEWARFDRLGSTEWARFDDGLDSMGSVRARLFHVLGLGSIVRLLGLG